ncbi:MAG: glucose 1-dehydrogenase [Blastocatellia bacterium]
MNFESKVVLVTGGSAGIGKATALEFGRRGAKVVIAARGVQQGEECAHEIISSGREAHFVRADMAQPDEIRHMVEETVRRFGRLDCAVNNAAVEGFPLKPLADVAESVFDQVMAVNLKGVWFCMKHEINQMLSQEKTGGAIVNISSVNGLGGTRGASAYAASKAGVIALIKSAALEYASAGVRINVLAAGAFETPMLNRVKDQLGGARAQAEEAYKSLIPMGRIGSPKEAANTIVWLCSDEASYVTGHSMIADGGLSAPMR